MIVIVELKETSQYIEYEKVKNTYQKGSFYCIYPNKDGLVEKIPINNIFRVKETYH